MTTQPPRDPLPARLLCYMILVAVVVGGAGAWAADSVQPTQHDLQLTEADHSPSSEPPASATTASLDELPKDAQQRMRAAMSGTEAWQSHSFSLTYEQLEYVEHNNTTYHVQYTTEKTPFGDWVLLLWAQTSALILGIGLIYAHRSGYGSPEVF